VLARAQLFSPLEAPLVPCDVKEPTPSPHTSQSWRIPRLQLNPHHRLAHQDYPLPHTMPSCTHISSWLYYFYGLLLHEPDLRFGMINQPGIYRVQLDTILNCCVQRDTICFPVTQMPNSRLLKRITIFSTTCDIN
jgi:hypothetical protein